MSLGNFLGRFLTSRDIQLPEWKPKAWNASNVDASLAELISYAEHNAEAAISWYYRNKRLKAWGSRALRFCSVILAGLGAVIPLMVAAGLFGKGSADNTIRNLQINQYGYLSIGLAALCLALDRFSASSTSWMRYITTATAIQTEVEKFRLDWERLTAPLGGRTPDGEPLLSLIKRITDFSVSVRALVESETRAWIAEFQVNMAELQKQSEAASEAARAQSSALQKEADDRRLALRPGAIDLTIENALSTDDGYDVSIDGEVAKAKVTSKSCGVLGVTPGLHEISTTATMKGAPAHASQIVDVTAGSATRVQMTLEKGKAPAKAA